MSKLSKIFSKNAIRLMLFGFLFLTLGAIPSLAQSTAKQDSICICGTKIEIDSALKMLNDYADLAEQARLFEQVYSDTKALTEIERSQILSALGLGNVWNVKQVKARIRRHKFRKWLWGAGGVMVGAVVAIAITI